LHLLSLGLMLWYGAHTHRVAVVWIVFGICALPSLSLVARGIYLAVRWVQNH
jgi:hypothetical protein